MGTHGENSKGMRRMASWILIVVTLGYLLVLITVLAVLHASTRREEHEARRETMKRHPSMWSRDGDSADDSPPNVDEDEEEE